MKQSFKTDYDEMNQKKIIFRWEEIRVPKVCKKSSGQFWYNR